ncbi:mechanosensitive ion channel family protein [Methylobacterium currus]|uniref:Mechanosensitive ion channel family protein n=1 Tax=Methylobacterium currus TaxID=2051553 RepID=A0A2R4WKV2_9HYPH|nr:DUF3772 domain-containing protein [Methylobacterium currus]AWB22160.1 mechanosensitive ion channel family protein [Methylobacterium currus]UHC18211.1 DUF3772 domain-containing protein [Methylobacterium currus]
MRQLRRWTIALAAALLSPGLAAAQGHVAKPERATVAQAQAPAGKGDTKPAQPAAGQPPAAPAAAPAEPPKPPPQTPISEQIKQIRAQLDAEKADLDQREQALTHRELNKDDLVLLREGIPPVADRLRQVVDHLGPRLDAAKERLNQLGPKPKEPEGADVAQERAQREAGVAEIDDTLRLARSLLVQSEQITDQISNRRRAAFTRALFERTDGLVSPNLWMRATSDYSRDLRALKSSLDDSVTQVQRRGTALNLFLLALAIGVSVALYVGRRHIAPRIGHRSSKTAQPTRYARVMAAWRVFLVGAVPAVLGSFLVGYTLDVTELLPVRLLPAAHRIVASLAFVAVVEAMADALLSPDRPAWRLVAMTDATAERLNRLIIAIASVIAVGRTIEGLNEGFSLSLPVTIVTKGVFAAVVAVVLAEGLRRFAARADTDEACLGPYIAAESTAGIGGPLRILGWIVVAAIGVSALVGYIALSSFLIDQLMWTAIAAAILYLAIASIDAVVSSALQDDSRIATALQANTGLRKRSLNQIAVLISGFVRVLLLTAAGVLLLASWGVDSTDIFTWAQAAFFGFTVGGVTISLSTIAIAIGLFTLGLVITRAVQRWLENTYLPATDLDPGLRNSISTVSGYVGFLLTLALAFSYLGLSLEKLTIVAGALSVGIGFGLQSIVNNFVSGLLLLWERPIRVGDLVVIGDNEGYVRRISVRSTEIQTFDRSAVIVPNSNLISGVVKNRVRGDRTGRVTITVSVLRNQDPVHAAELIVGCAKAHPEVLKEPPPRVVFRKIGDPFLEFELIAMISDVGSQAKVQSDLNFAVFKTLSDGGLIPNLGPGASIVTVQGLDAMQDAMGQIARMTNPAAFRPEARNEPEAERRRTPETVP